MLTRAEKARRIALTIMALAALGFFVFKVYSEQPPPRGHCDFADCAKDETLRAVLPVGGNGESNPTDVSTLDPARVAVGDTTAMTVVSQLFDGLVTFDKDLNVEPWGAKSWTISPDGLTYTFTLQPNQKFADGTPVKPSDYAWSLNRSIDPCLGESSNAVYWALIKDATSFHAEACSIGRPTGAIKTLVGRSIVPDDSANRLTIKVAHPAVYFLAALAYPWAFVVDQKVVTGDHLGKNGRWLDSLVFGTTGEGNSGMFYLSKWDHAGGMVLKQNPNFWGRKPNFTPVYYTFVNTSENPNAAFDTFKADPSLGFISMLPDAPDKLARPPIDPTIYLAEPALKLAWLAFNPHQAPFDNINARKAFCLAVNREHLNQQVYQGVNRPGWNIIPRGMPGSDYDWPRGIDNAPVTGDSALAQRYWQRYLAAHGGHAPALTLYAPDPQAQPGQLMAMLRDQWQQTFGTSIRLYTTGDPLAATLAPIIWSPGYLDLQAVMSQAVLWDGKRISTPADALLRRADALSDIYQRIPLYQQAEQQLIDNATVCPLLQYANYYAVRTWVRGSFTQDARGLIPNDAWLSGYVLKH